MKLLSSALAGSALLVLTGCVTPQSAANSNPGDNTTAGTIMGGMIGAIAGMEMSSKEDRKKGAIIGAIVRASAGNAIGQTLDQQAADLRRDLNNDQVDVTNTGSELIVTMPQDILFALDSAAVRSDLRRDLGVVAGNYRPTRTPRSRSKAIRTTPEAPTTTKPCHNAARLPSRMF